MYASQWFMPTQKEIPHDADILSQQYMLRAGLIRKLGSGLYHWLPTGLKILQRIELIIREEMNRAGAMELLMPAIQPSELWQETGRWETFGAQLLTMKDSHDRAYCFGPTHEEVITDLIRQTVHSYKQLPLCFYQIQTKFRDEIRPRFGVMRAREFLMKDAYSFHLNETSLQETYQKMYDAYSRIFTRMNLTFRAVEADTGSIGGAVSHEFQVLADSGEDIVCYSDSSSYAANLEQATCLIPSRPLNTPSHPITLVETMHQKTIEEVAAYLNISPNTTIKTLLVRGNEHPIVALILRGNDTLNDVKAMKHPWIKSPLQWVDSTEIESTLNLPVGYIGPVGLTIPMIVDTYAHAMPSFVCGANLLHQHYQHVQWDRDVTATEIYDLRNVQPGDLSPDHQGTLQFCRGIEVGHVFQLGQKYAHAMQAKVSNAQGESSILHMGCYGIGVSRLVAAVIEQHHDDHGIQWPINIAPFHIGLIPIGFHRDERIQQQALSIYDMLKNLGFDVLLDDRAERPGVLFADHDLMGIPHRLVISEKLLAQNQIEYQSRVDRNPQLLSLETLSDCLSSLILLK